MVGSMHLGLKYLCSPFASAIINTLSERHSAFLGSTLAASGVLWSSFVTNVDLYFLTWGLLVGVGTSLLYAPSIVILGHYFRRKLGMACGIAGLGASFLTIIVPIVMSVTTERFGFQWSLRGVSLLFFLSSLCVLTWTPQVRRPRAEITSEGSRSLASRFTMEARQTRRYLSNRYFRSPIWSNPAYRFWALVMPIAFLGFFVPFVHLVGFGTYVVPLYYLRPKIPNHVSRKWLD